MNTLRDYFRRLTTSQTGRYITIVMAALAAVVVVRGCQQPKLAVDVSNLVPRDTSGERVREMDDRRLPPPQPVSKTNATTPVLPAIRFAVSNAPAPSAGLVLPGRRLIPCKLVNTVVKTYPNVSQFWTYEPKAFLAAPVYSRDVPPSKNIEP